MKPFPRPSRNPSSVLGRNASLLSSGSVARPGFGRGPAWYSESIGKSVNSGAKNPYLIASQWRFLSISAGLL